MFYHGIHTIYALHISYIALYRIICHVRIHIYIIIYIYTYVIYTYTRIPGSQQEPNLLLNIILFEGVACSEVSTDVRPRAGNSCWTLLSSQSASEPVSQTASQSSS